MIAKSVRSKRRYTLMRQEIIQAARQILLDQGIDALSMRTIARVVQTSPANLYEYFLNKEEIIFSVYNDILSNLRAALQGVNSGGSGQAQLVALCIRYINFVNQDPTQLQIAGHLFQLQTLTQPPRSAVPTAAMQHTATTATPTVQASINDRTGQSNHINYVNPATTAYTAQTKEIFALFLQAVQQCRDEGTIASVTLTDHEITHIVWAFVHGLVTLRIQEISTIDHELMFTVLANFVDSLAAT